MTTDLFDLAVTLLTIRRRGDMRVSIPGLPAADHATPESHIWTRFLAEIESEIISGAHESTTETADIALVRRMPSYDRFVRAYPELVDRISIVTTVRESEEKEVDDH